LFSERLRLRAGGFLSHGASEGREMRILATRAKNLLSSEDATAATEYAVMLGLIVLVALVSITLLGEHVRDFFFGTSADLPDGKA
jgi:Flp pilus assembly pilin Flp